MRRRGRVGSVQSLRVCIYPAWGENFVSVVGGGQNRMRMVTILVSPRAVTIHRAWMRP